MDPRQKIENLIESGLRSGLFTHSFVSCGFLSETSSLFEAFQAANSDEAKIFDLASLTKALVTGPLVLKELESLGLRYDEPLETLSSQLPPVTKGQLGALSIGSLLGHFSGLPAWWNFWIGNLDADTGPMTSEQRALRIESVFSRISISGDSVDNYSDLGYILLGYVLELRGKTDLSDLFSRYKTELGGDHLSPTLGYRPLDRFKQSSCVPSAFCALRERLIQGDVHDENAASMGGIAGHAGLFGSGPDLKFYLKALYDSSIGRRYLLANEKARLQSSHEGLRGLRRGTGPSAELFSRGTSMGHLGFTGTAFWLDLDTSRYGIWLSNRVISSRISPQIQEFRRRIFGHFNDILE